MNFKNGLLVAIMAGFILLLGGCSESSSASTTTTETAPAPDQNLAGELDVPPTPPAVY